MFHDDSLIIPSAFQYKHIFAEALLMSIHNVCLYGEITKKISYRYDLTSPMRLLFIQECLVDLCSYMPCEYQCFTYSAMRIPVFYSFCFLASLIKNSKITIFFKYHLKINEYLFFPSIDFNLTVLTYDSRINHMKRTLNLSTVLFYP